MSTLILLLQPSVKPLVIGEEKLFRISVSQCYCTDTLFGTAAVVQEMLLYSNTGEIELLPALPDGFEVGSVLGLVTRTRVEVECLVWDLPKKQVQVTLRSNQEQIVTVSIGVRCKNI